MIMALAILRCWVPQEIIIEMLGRNYTKVLTSFYQYFRPVKSFGVYALCVHYVRCTVVDKCSTILCQFFLNQVAIDESC